VNKPFHVQWNGGANAPKIGHLAQVATLQRRYRLDGELFVEVHRVDDKHQLKLICSNTLESVVASMSEESFTKLAQLRNVIALVECGAVAKLPTTDPWI
jgi:hypothetical protein